MSLEDLKHDNIDNNIENDIKNTEWGSLAEEVPFSGDVDGSEKDNDSAEKERQAVSEFVDNHYNTSVSRIVFKAFYEGSSSYYNNSPFYSEAKDPDAYIHPDVFEGMLSEEEMQDVVQTFANGGELNDEYRDKVKNGLVDLIMKSSMLDELREDPFLEHRRVEQLCGRQESPTVIEESNLQDLLWSGDFGFDMSPEAYGLLSDPDFLERQYHYSKETEGQKLQSISNTLRELVDHGNTCVSELIDDPYLRKSRFDQQYDLKSEKPVNLKIIAPQYKLWIEDNEYYDSLDYGGMLIKYATENPDIFGNPDENEMNSILSEALNKLSDDKIEDIIRGYEKDIRNGDFTVVKTLLPMVGLENNPPRIVYRSEEENDDNSCGYYDDDDHTINLYADSIERNSDYSGGAVFERIDTIAHELWHAHQHFGENVPEERSEKYQKNFTYYIGPKKSFSIYRSQITEVEAWAFGNQVGLLCQEYYNRSRNEE